MLCLATLHGHAAEKVKGAQLYATRLQSITIPHYLQQKCVTALGSKLSSIYVYLVVASDGTPAWVSPKQKVIKNQTRFEWPSEQGSMFALPWGEGNKMSIKVFLSGNAVEASFRAGAIAGGAGAAIGFLVAGAFTGGLGAPAGAFIGALLGGVPGTATGVALSTKDQIVFEIECPSNETFPLDGRLDYNEARLGEKHTASVSFQLLDAKASIEQGDLMLGEKYIVWIRTIHLSEAAALKGGKQIDQAKYYVVLKQGTTKYPFLKDIPFALPADVGVNIPITTVLKNTGHSTEVQIYKKNRILRDALVFTSTIGKTDGKSWAFIGKATSDDIADESFVNIETFGPLTDRPLMLME